MARKKMQYRVYCTAFQSALAHLLYLIAASLRCYLSYEEAELKLRGITEAQTCNANDFVRMVQENEKTLDLIRVSLICFDSIRSTLQFILFFVVVVA